MSLFAQGPVLVALAFADGVETMHEWLRRRFGDFHTRPGRDPAGTASALRAYFAGDLSALDDVEVDTGGTEFQRAVWSELRRIRPGATLSYASLARRVDHPTAVRAVGAANGSNPIPLIIPCHRVVASDGTLCGYGGGLETKRWLLSHEKVLAPGASRVPATSSQLRLL